MITRLGSTELLHCAVQHGNVVYLSGVTADERSAGMAGQTLQVLEKIAKWLAHFGSDRAHMLSASIYLSDMSMKEEMNAVWKKWFGGQDMPARATIGSSDLGPGVLIEIVVTAASVGKESP